MILTLLAIWFGYKKAKSTGRNPILWAAIAGGSFLVTQLLCGLGIGVLMGLGVILLGWPESVFTDYEWVATIIAILASIGVLLIVFRFLDKVPGRLRASRHSRAAINTKVASPVSRNSRRFAGKIRFH